MSGDWFVRIDGNIHGPYDSTKLARYAREGRIAADTEVCQNRHGPWMQANRIPGLFPPPLPKTASAPRNAPPPPLLELDDLPPSAPARGGYVQSNLLPGERVVYWAKLHWFIFIAPLVVQGLALLIGVAVLVVAQKQGYQNTEEHTQGLVVGLGVAGFMSLIGLIMLMERYITYVSSEFAVTTKRVVMKTGFIRRRTLELLHNRIDSLGVDQGILGRIFNYGSVGVAVATEKQAFHYISSPLEFRKQVQARQTI